MAVWTAVGLSGVPDARAQSPVPPPSIQPWSATPAGQAEPTPKKNKTGTL
ncbi:MAG: hypothetical protein ACO26I_02765 [Burkholderiaceae bacterium]